MTATSLISEFVEPAAAPSPPADEQDDARGAGTTYHDLLIYVGLAGLIASAWWVSRLGLFRPSDDTSYWIAVAGGSMMLILFAYPLRKYMKFMQRFGKVKWWFWLHLGLGLAGPWLILVHAGFQVGSLNAAVALYSMVTVVISGVVGRFIHVRVHRGLNGERTSLARLRERAGLVESEARSRLHFAPKVEARLLAFEQRELEAAPGWRTYLRQAILLPAQGLLTRRRCMRDLRERLVERAAEKGRGEDDRRRRERRAGKLVERYLNAVVKVAQFTAYERLFALWHVAHLPFVYLLVISAVVHVIAVHAY